MEVKLIRDSLVDVTFTVDDCAMLGRICQYAANHDMFSANGERPRGLLLEAFAAAFQGMATAALAVGQIYRKDSELFMQEVAALHLPAEDSWYMLRRATVGNEPQEELVPAEPA